MQFLGNLGIDIWLLIAQIVNFGILLLLLTKFVYKPLIKRIEKDETALKEVYREREELDKKTAELEKEERRRSARSKEQAKEIVKEAEELASDITTRAQEETMKEKEAVIAQIRLRLHEIEGTDHHE